MKRKTKETILEIVSILSLILVLVFTGCCEQGKMTLTQYIVHASVTVIIGAVSVIALRIMEVSTNE